MRMICIALWLVFASIQGYCQDAGKLQARISLMHRRDGGTAQSYDSVSYGAAIEYPSRNRSEMFRVYGISLLGKHLKVAGIVIESYKNNRLLSTTNPRFSDHGVRISFVDGYISKKESKVKVRLLFEGNAGRENEWFFFVNFK